MQGWNSSIKIKGLQCLFNRIFCLEAVSWTEVDAINAEGQIQSSIFIEDWTDAVDSPTNDQLISPWPSPLPLQLATLDSAFMAVFLVLAKKVTFYRSSTASVVGAGIAVSTVVVGETVT